MLSRYFNVAHALDRNRSDATLLQFWACQPADHIVPRLTSLCRSVMAQNSDLAAELAEMKNSGTFAAEEKIYEEVAAEIKLLDAELLKCWDQDVSGFDNKL